MCDSVKFELLTKLFEKTEVFNEKLSLDLCRAESKRLYLSNRAHIVPTFYYRKWSFYGCNVFDLHNIAELSIWHNSVTFYITCK